MFNGLTLLTTKAVGKYNYTYKLSTPYTKNWLKQKVERSYKNMTFYFHLQVMAPWVKLAYSIKIFLRSPMVM